jgi:hypothetical protein
MAGAPTNGRPAIIMPGSISGRPCARAVSTLGRPSIPESQLAVVEHLVETGQVGGLAPMRVADKVALQQPATGEQDADRYRDHGHQSGANRMAAKVTMFRV